MEFVRVQSLRQQQPAAGQGAGGAGVMDPSIRRRPLSAEWEAWLGDLDVALLPIANLNTGRLYGFEARLFRCPMTGSAEGSAFWNAAHEEGCLETAHLVLYHRALEQFLGVPREMQDLRLLMPVHGGLLADANVLAERIAGLTTGMGIRRRNLGLVLVMEQGIDMAVVEDAAAGLRRICGQLGVARFGGEHGSPLLLHGVQPGIARLDERLLEGLPHDSRKKVIVSGLVGIAHRLGMRVLAPGIVDEITYYACKEAAVDLVTGPILGAEGQEASEAPRRFAIVEALSAGERRRGQTDETLIAEVMDTPSALAAATPMSDAWSVLRSGPRVLPVIDAGGLAIGTLTRDDAWRIISGEAAGAATVVGGLRPAPTLEIHRSLEEAVSALGDLPQGTPLLITEDGLYRGLLSASGLVTALRRRSRQNEATLSPLSHLPNASETIGFLRRAVTGSEATWTLVFIDIDDFRLFNDNFGHRRGDNVIAALANALRTEIPVRDRFIGHIGADRFMVALQDMSSAGVRELVGRSVARFERLVSAFFDADSRRMGRIQLLDQYGVSRSVGLLAVSEVLVRMARGGPRPDVDDLLERVALLREEARHAPDKVAEVEI